MSRPISRRERRRSLGQLLADELDAEADDAELDVAHIPLDDDPDDTPPTAVPLLTFACPVCHTNLTLDNAP